MYIFLMGLERSYGHNFQSAELPELVQFDGIIARYGVVGGSNGCLHGIYRLFDRLYNEK